MISILRAQAVGCISAAALPKQLQGVGVLPAAYDNALSRHLAHILSKRFYYILHAFKIVQMIRVYIKHYCAGRMQC